jgi:hypothetical protein
MKVRPKNFDCFKDLSKTDLMRLMMAAQYQNSQHPDFEDHSDDPFYEGQLWFDPKAEVLFSRALEEMIRRSGGKRFTIEFPDGFSIEFRP